MTRATILAVVSAMTLAIGSAPAFACSCVDSGPACQAYWKSGPVFDATVDSIDVPRADAGRPPGEALETVHVTVHQSWKGSVAPGPLTIATNTEGPTCGYPFEVGVRYLIFASTRSSDGLFQVSRCSATQEYAGTGDAAAFLGSLSEPARGGRIFGTVMAAAQPFGADHLIRRPVDARVTLFDGYRTRSTVAKGGAFDFDHLKPATYGIRVEPPRGLVDTGVARTVEIPDPRACARELYFLQRAGRITGRVVGPDGHPAAMLRIDAARDTWADEFPVESSVTRSDGTFEFADLPAGRYIVGINLRNAPPPRGSHARMIYPARGPGHTIAVGDRAVDIGDWKLVLPIR